MKCLGWSKVCEVVVALFFSVFMAGPAGAATGVISVQISTEAQALVGAWSVQGSDWVFFFLSNGRGAVVGTGLDSACAGVTVKSGNFSVANGAMTLNGDNSYWCGNDNVPDTPGVITANYVVSGTFLTLNKLSFNDKGISQLSLTALPPATKSMSGIWGAKGTDWVWKIYDNGQITVSGTGVVVNCDIASAYQGTYTATPTEINFSMTSGNCGNNTTVSPMTGVARFAYNGSSVTMFVDASPSTNLAQPAGFILNFQGTAVSEPAPVKVTTTTPLPPPPAAQVEYTAPAGKIPDEAVTVNAVGTFGSATVSVTLNVLKALQGTLASGFAAGGYNVYVLALVPGALLGSSSPVFFVKTPTPVGGPPAWSGFSLPLASYMQNVDQNAKDNQIVIDIVAQTDITALVGTEIYIGYGISDTEMLEKGRYRGVYKFK